MDNISANNFTNATTKVSSWVPQIYFDLIARIIPGGLALALLCLSFFGVNNSFSAIYIFFGKDLGFPSILAIILLIIGMSYSYAICTWGLWYGLYGGLRKILNKNIDQETFVTLKCNNVDFPDLYERIKKHDISAGNRLTKLKAEIHMTGTLITSGFLSLFLLSFKLIKEFNSESIYFIFIIIIAIIGLLFALRHFVSRARKIVENASVICSE